MTKEMERLITKIEGCVFIAKMDAKTLSDCADRTSFCADVARYNKDNMEQLSVYIRQLYEEMDRENREYGQVEECPFISESVPF